MTTFVHDVYYWAARTLDWEQAFDAVRSGSAERLEEIRMLRRLAASARAWYNGDVGSLRKALAEYMERFPGTI